MADDRLCKRTGFLVKLVRAAIELTVLPIGWMFGWRGRFAVRRRIAGMADPTPPVFTLDKASVGAHLDERWM